MKKMCFLWFFMGFVTITSAQDIAPGQQAQGYLDDKNTTVDYATGIFHYKVPLYTLGDGGFSLPVSLDYTAKGVKTEDRPGLIGYNWTLNTGGVVTRTIRGGIADETSFYGYLYYLRQSDAVPLTEDAKRVNRHQRDGESDIFTAVFNGQSVHFMLGLDAANRICALPLERTNVRIECEQNGLYTIDGWTVTDEEGNRYIYRQKEWSADIVKEEAVSFNGLRDKSYVSSWYLSRIEPVNGSPLVYHYLADVWQSGQQDDILLSHFYSGYTTRYVYGRKLLEHTFDFGPYRADFNTAISQALGYLNNYSIEMQVNNSLYEFDRAGQWVRNPNFEQGAQAISNNFRVMGQLADFRNISSASNELINILNQLYNTYSAESSHNAQMAASWFRTAKGYLTESLRQVEEVSEREVGNGMALTVRSPLLERIVCGNNVLRFGYKSYGYNCRLTSLQSGSVSGTRFSGVELENYDHLNRLSFTGCDSTRVRTLNFEYYATPSGSYATTDVWGYYGNSSDSDVPYWVLGDAEYIRISSLKSITLSDGGKIQLDYEPNRSIPYLYPGSGSLTDSMSYGGLRLKSLVYHDGVSASGDTVLYRYPLPGIPMYPEITNVEVLQYSGFSDRLEHSRMKFKGLAFLNTGNNGLYYRQVEEIRPGRGKKSYAFHVPFCFLVPVYAQYYPFWLAGLPLSVSEYDEEGHLLRSVHNHYETDFSMFFSDFDLNLNASYFSACPSGFGYTGVCPQLKADENYMDAEYLENYYRSQQTVLIYRDGSIGYSLSPYYDVYLPNIQPRTTRQPSNVAYTLYYGGKTLLKSQKEYRYASPDSDGELFCTTEYFYDNPAGSVRPTRVVRTDACGERYTEATTRVTEMNVAADTSIARLVAANMLSLPVKQAYLKNDSLLTETVNVYATVAGNMRQGVGVKARYSYAPQQPPAYQMNIQAPTLFTYGRSNYTLEEENDYRWTGDLCLPSDCRNRTSETAFCHDRYADAALLEVASVRSTEITAMDLHSYSGHFSEREFPLNLLLHCHVGYKRFHAALLAVPEDAVSFRQYLSSSPQDLFCRLIEIVGCNRTDAYGELPALCDSVKAHENDFTQFLSICADILEQWAPKDEDFPLYTAVNGIVLTVYRDLLSDPFFLALGEIVSDYEDSDSALAVYPAAGTDRLCLYAICKSKNTDLSWNVYHSGGVTAGSGQIVSTSGYSLQRFDIDLSSFGGVSCVRVSLSSLDSGLHYLALVPAGASFQATSYNADGTVFCTFDQTGRMEANEYDAAGRLLRVRDQHDRLLESYEHHVVNP